MARKSEARSRSSARAGAGARTRTGCCRSTRGPARPRPRRASGPGTRRRSRCWQSSARSGGLSSSAGASAGYRGQIGAAQLVGARGRAQRSSSGPATCSSPRRARRSGATTPSSSAAMIIGPPTDEMRRLFDHTVAAQEAAFDAIRPGATCADVDRRGHALLRGDTTCSAYWRQHTGHGIGLRNHEAPFLDVGDDTPLEPGMVFTIEPGALRLRRSAASATRTPSSSPRTGWRSSPTIRATSTA